MLHETKVKVAEERTGKLYYKTTRSYIYWEVSIVDIQLWVHITVFTSLFTLHMTQLNTKATSGNML